MTCLQNFVLPFHCCPDHWIPSIGIWYISNIGLLSETIHAVQRITLNCIVQWGQPGKHSTHVHQSSTITKMAETHFALSTTVSLARLLNKSFTMLSWPPLLARCKAVCSKLFLASTSNSWLQCISHNI